VRVKLFAGMAEAAGGRHLDIDWHGGSVADLRVAVAIDGRYALDETAVGPGMDVAIIPPVSGG